MRYFTKEWFNLGQKRTYNRKQAEALRKQIDAVSDAYWEAQKKENLPEDLCRKFYFHDGKIRNVQAEKDYILEIDSPFTNYHKLTFRDAILKQESIETGAVWLYAELYRHALGYEVHILSQVGWDLRDTKIICSEILIEE